MKFKSERKVSNLLCQFRPKVITFAAAYKELSGKCYITSGKGQQFQMGDISSTSAVGLVMSVADVIWKNLQYSDFLKDAKSKRKRTGEFRLMYEDGQILDALGITEVAVPFSGRMDSLMFDIRQEIDSVEDGTMRFSDKWADLLDAMNKLVIAAYEMVSEINAASCQQRERMMVLESRKKLAALDALLA